MTYIPRAMERELLRLLGQYKAVLVTGARQVGKSTMLRKVLPDRPYVTLDDPWLEDQAKNQTAMFLMMHPSPVTLDEVQRAPALFRYIKLKCDESESYGLFCLSGSQAFHLMHNASESLSGRIAILELSSLSQREITGDPCALPFAPTMEYLSERAKTVKKTDNLWPMIHRGGYPFRPRILSAGCHAPPYQHNYSMSVRARAHRSPHRGWRL